MQAEIPSTSYGTGASGATARILSVFSLSPPGKWLVRFNVLVDAEKNYVDGTSF